MERPRAIPMQGLDENRIKQFYLRAIMSPQKWGLLSGETCQSFAFAALNAGGLGMPPCHRTVPKCAAKLEEAYSWFRKKRAIFPETPPAFVKAKSTDRRQAAASLTTLAKELCANNRSVWYEWQSHQYTEACVALGTNAPALIVAEASRGLTDCPKGALASLIACPPLEVAKRETEKILATPEITTGDVPIIIDTSHLPRPRDKKKDRRILIANYQRMADEVDELCRDPKGV
jgi:hypothetical protein